MGLQLYQKNLLEKLKESLGAVLPIIGIVLVLCFSIAPIPNSVLMTFVVGAVLLIIGMMFFTLGAEMAMTPMGERIETDQYKKDKCSDSAVFYSWLYHHHIRTGSSSIG